MTDFEYQIFVDMDGVLTDYMGSALEAMREAIKNVISNQELYKTKYPKFYKAAKKAVAEQDGDLENGIPGMPLTEEDVAKGTSKKKVRNFMYAVVSNDYDFWANLKWTDDGRELWSYVSKHDPYVLSAPQGPNSKKGKIEWCKRELGIGSNRIILTSSKYGHAPEDEDTIGVLIDDMEKYLSPWQNAGGIGIQHENAQSTIQQLKELGL